LNSLSKFIIGELGALRACARVPANRKEEEDALACRGFRGLIGLEMLIEGAR
jgi:hypothetical protein